MKKFSFIFPSSITIFKNPPKNKKKKQIKKKKKKKKKQPKTLEVCIPCTMIILFSFSVELESN